MSERYPGDSRYMENPPCGVHMTCGPCTEPFGHDGPHLYDDGQVIRNSPEVEPPMTRCPKCGQEGVHPRDSSCIPEADAPTPAPSLLDFNRARKAGGVTFYSPGPQLVAEEADLNAQAAALVETAVETNRARIVALLNAATDQYARMKVVAEEAKDATLMSLATLKWEALSDATGYIEALTVATRDDHR